MNMESEELIGYIYSSSLRRDVIKFLEKNTRARPIEIAKSIGKYQSHISNVLIAFEKEGLVKCITPQKRTWRVYTLTEVGKNVSKKM